MGRSSKWIVIVGAVAAGVFALTAVAGGAATQSRRSGRSLPACNDNAPKERSMREPATAGEPGQGRFETHELRSSTIQQAHQRVERSIEVAALPEWVRCQEADAFWMATEGDVGSRTIVTTFFDGNRSADASRAIRIQFSNPAPSVVPIAGAEWVEIEGRSDWYREERQDLPEGAGVRISWLKDGSYFELIGPVDLDEALEIADSVSVVD